MTSKKGNWGSVGKNIKGKTPMERILDPSKETLMEKILKANKRK